MTELTVDELIAERVEKAGESHMIAQAHRDAGKEGAAQGWALSGEYAQATADHLSRLTGALRAVLEAAENQDADACHNIAFFALNPKPNTGATQ